MGNDLWVLSLQVVELYLLEVAIVRRAVLSISSLYRHDNRLNVDYRRLLFCCASAAEVVLMSM
jgi:hypothetical protein